MRKELELPIAKKNQEYRGIEFFITSDSNGIYAKVFMKSDGFTDEIYADFANTRADAEANAKRLIDEKLGK